MRRVHVDTRPFNAMCRQLARISGASFQGVVDYEVAKVTEKSISGVPAAKIEKIKKSVASTYASREEKERLFKAKRAARGLAKQGFRNIGVALGLDLRAPGYVARATPSDGRTYDNTTVTRRGSGGRYRVTVATSQPTLLVPGVGGERVFRAAIRGRVKYFQASLRKGVFDSVREIARRYPGVRTSR